MSEALRMGGNGFEKGVPNGPENSKTHFLGLCACGCGRRFVFSRKWQRYASRENRLRAYRYAGFNPERLYGIKASVEKIIKETQEVLEDLRGIQGKR